ncbi:hypothetical protein [Emticicia agri]|uniref:Lipoprotein n=1 Tax=Emticicia agri TaxID=2492393 RepID=A0A4Q5M078_9BACT|nr:hypothetical protein [Emticicia agri]RYU95237.1 hypothetical protein EWM59_13390 [Emticicia agri]
MTASLTRLTNRFTLFFVLLLGISACQSSLTKKVKYYSTEITLKNGTVLKGSTSPIANESFTFKDAKTSKKSTIQNKEVQSIIKNLPEGTREYAQIEVETNKKREKTETVLGAYVVKGILNLISYEATEHTRQVQTVNNRQTFVNETILAKHYYLKWDNAPGKEVNMGKRKGQEEDFMDTALEFFADAPELMKKIGSEGYQAKDIKKIVEEYNAIKSKK